MVGGKARLRLVFPPENGWEREEDSGCKGVWRKETDKRRGGWWIARGGDRRGAGGRQGLLDPGDDGLGELRGGTLSAQVSGDGLAVSDGLCVRSKQVHSAYRPRNINHPLRLARLTSKMAFSMLSAYSNKFMCLNIIIEDNNKAVGLANPFPAISGAEP